MLIFSLNNTCTVKPQQSYIIIRYAIFSIILLRYVLYNYPNIDCIVLSRRQQIIASGDTGSSYVRHLGSDDLVRGREICHVTMMGLKGFAHFVVRGVYERDLQKKKKVLNVCCCFYFCTLKNTCM